VTAEHWLFCDMDGTLADSIGVLRDVLARFLTEAGRSWDEQLFATLNGASLDGIVSALRARGLRGSHVAIKARYLDELANCYRQVPPMPGAQALLDTARQSGCRLALVTAAEQRCAKGWLQARGWRELFSFIVGGDQVARAKPAPDLYRLAVTRSGADPARVVVLEDSPNGVQAALSAGLSCWSVGLDTVGALPCADLHAASNRLRQRRAEAWPIARGPVQVVEVPAEQPDGDRQRRIDQIWQQACRERPDLFNGPILAMVDWSWVDGGIQLRARRSCYAEWLAGHRDSSLAMATVAITGGVRSPNREWLIGRRQQVSSWSQHWELIPGGVLEPGVSCTDHAKQELQEECGLQACSACSFGLLYDAGCPAWDIAVDLGCASGGIRPSSEHSEIRWCKADEMKRRLGKWVPTVQAWMELMGLSKRSSEGYV